MKPDLAFDFKTALSVYLKLLRDDFVIAYAKKKIAYAWPNL